MACLVPGIGVGAVADPAIEAARNAWRVQFGMEPLADDSYTIRSRTLAAREALKPIRELHTPEIVRSPDDEQWTECTSCYGAHWPCETAKSIYTSEELS